MKKFILFFAILFTLIACNRDDKNNDYSGTYTEVTPFANRTKVVFESNTNLIIIKEGNTSDNFIYEITNDKIKLTHIDSNTTSELKFEKKSENEFEIENLYVSIPEDETVYMTFKK